MQSRDSIDKVTVLVQGSAEEPYEVTFYKGATGLMAFCTCPAGENRSHCKHRINILIGDVSNVVGGNKDGLTDVLANWLPHSRVGQLLTECDSAEKELEECKKKLSRLRKELASTMHGV